ETPQAGFDQPLALLSDCHRRVEKFLGILRRLAREHRGGELNAERREAMAAGLRYFRSAAPWHTQDEEASLFPRLRASKNPLAQEAVRRIDALEADHALAGPIHDTVDRLASRWLEQGRLPDDEVETLVR